MKLIKLTMKSVLTLVLVYGFYNLISIGISQGKPQSEPAACRGNSGGTGSSTNAIIVFQEVQSGDLPAGSSANTYIEPSEAEKQCPVNLPNNASAPLKDRSLCPWYSVLNRNQYRVPKIISEARCRCNKCVVPRHESYYEDCQCEQIYQNFKVLKRIAKCANGQFVYRLETERIPIGCACAVRRQAVSSGR